MASRPTHEVVATVGEYTAKDGTKKKRYQRVGTIFKGDDGRASMKLDAIPLSREWSGWLSFYPIEKDPPSSPPTNRPASPPADYQEDDDIPF